MSTSDNRLLGLILLVVGGMIAAVLCFGVVLRCGRDDTIYCRLEEPALVLQTIYSPADHGIGYGVGTSGHFTLSTIAIPETKGVVFQCRHGRFYVESAALWSRLVVGDTVIVGYEECLSVHTAKHEKGVDTTLTLKKRDFLYARTGPDTVWQEGEQERHSAAYVSGGTR